MTQLPVVGNIPHSSDGSNTVVLENPNSALAESYRLLRSRMQFLTKDAKSPVILVTSSMPGEGKTFTSINLASVYSLLGKKTVLVGFDLRKPKIFQDFKTMIRVFPHGLLVRIDCRILFRRPLLRTLCNCCWSCTSKSIGTHCPWKDGGTN